MTRDTWARIVNLAVPGSGLILLRREWLGLALAALFATLGQVAILGTWVIPLEVPTWLAMAAAIIAVGIWGHAQWLLHTRIGLAASPVMADELVALRKRAADAIARGDHEDAERILLVALNIHDEDAETAELWARLKSARGEREAARRGWRRVLVLSRCAEQRRAAREALAAL